MAQRKNPIDTESIDWYEIAYDLINGELDEFDHSPREYIKSMGWNLKKFKRIGDLRNELYFTTSETQALADKLSSEGFQDMEDIAYSDAASDLVVNLIAGKIIRTYKIMTRRR